MVILPDMPRVETIILRNCWNLEVIPRLQSLRKLRVENCVNLHTVSYCPNLKVAKFIGCKRLKAGLGIVPSHIPDFRIREEPEGKSFLEKLVWICIGVILLRVVANSLLHGTIKEILQNYFYGKQL
jgi:hypothetical protein